jgi:hypothetical protein
MKDEVMLEVTKIVDDDTGIWADDLCETGIKVGILEDFLKHNGEEGLKEFFGKLDFLKTEVTEIYKKMNKDIKKEEKFNLKSIRK